MQSRSATANRGLSSFLRVAPLLSLGVLGSCTAFGGWLGLASSLVGIAGTAVFLWGTWTIVRLVGAAAGGGKPTPLQVTMTVVALLMKLPLIYVGWLVAKRLGPFGPTCFLLGLGLVYFLVIWRAALTVRD